MKTCFVSAPANVDLSTLRSVLLEHNYRAVFPFEFIGIDIQSALQGAIAKADLCLLVFSAKRDNSSVIYEIGYARALQKRVLIIQEERGSLPGYLLGLPTIVANLQEEVSLSSSLGQALRQLRGARSVATKKTPVRALANQTEDLLSRLRSHGPGISEVELESVILKAFRESGIQTLAENKERDKRYDAAIWIDELQDRIGNPILIEFRKRLTPDLARETGLHFIEKLAWATARALLVIYVSGPEEAISRVNSGAPLVFFIKAETLLEALRTKSLAAMLWEQRNRLVHGV